MLGKVSCKDLSDSSSQHLILSAGALHVQESEKADRFFENRKEEALSVSVIHVPNSHFSEFLALGSI